MATITPQFNLTSTAATGPSSIALTLSNSNTYTCDNFLQGMHTCIESDAGQDPQKLFDGSYYAELWASAATNGTGYTAGTVGGYVYLKNTALTSATTELIVVGIMPASTEADDNSITFTRDIVAPHSSEEAAENGLGLATGDSARTFTLKPQEWTWFPWDYNSDIYVESLNANSPVLEWWLFDRA